jgi:enoyl-CoA hydratase/carnithine racemase
MLTAERALALGIVDEVGDDLATLVDRARRRLGEHSGAAMAMRRRLILDAARLPFDAALDAHLATCDRELRRRRDRRADVLPANERPDP